MGDKGSPLLTMQLLKQEAFLFVLRRSGIVILSSDQKGLFALKPELGFTSSAPSCFQPYSQLQKSIRDLQDITKSDDDGLR